MNAQSAASPPSRHRLRARPRIRAHARPHITVALRVSLGLGLFLGFYAGALHRTQGATPAEATVVGVVSAAAATVIYYAASQVQKRLMAVLRAPLWGALFGCSIGYLRSLSGADLLTSSLQGLLWGLGMTVAAAYYCLIHER